VTLIDGVRLLWLAAGIVALLFANRKLEAAQSDHSAHVTEGGNGAVLHAGRWRIRTARYAVALALILVVAALLSTLDWVLAGPARFNIITLVVLTLWPLAFAASLVDDDRNHQLLLDLITTRPAAQKRKMDEHTVSERERER